LQNVHRGSHQVIVEGKFGGGYSGTRVILTPPIADDDSHKARKVTKLGPALELGREQDTYTQFVENVLPFCALPTRLFEPFGALRKSTWGQPQISEASTCLRFFYIAWR